MSVRIHHSLEWGLDIAAGRVDDGAMTYPYPMQPRDRSATVRRELRRDIRNALGPSSDGAPEGPQVLRAARQMAELLELATNGRYGLMLTDSNGRVRSFTDVMKDERELREARQS